MLISQASIFSEPKVAFVTGATRGIGYETACKLAEKGYRVYGTFRSAISNIAQLDEAIKRFGGLLNKVELLLESDESIQKAVNAVFDREGRIDILVNNAAMVVDGPVMSASSEQMMLMFRVNCVGPTMITQLVADKMRQVDRTLSILSVGSAVDIAPNPAQGTYSATKAASRFFTESLSLEIALLQNAKVTIVQLGGASTNALDNTQFGSRNFVGRDRYPLFNESAQEISKMGLKYGSQPSEIAEKIVQVIEDPEAKLRVQIDQFTKDLVVKFAPDGTGQNEFAMEFLNMCGYIKQDAIDFQVFSSLNNQRENLSEFVTQFYLQNHEEVKKVYEGFEGQDIEEKRANFVKTFKQAMQVSFDVISRNKGHFFVVKDPATHEVIGYTMGMPYRPSIQPLTPEFFSVTQKQCPEFFNIFAETMPIIMKYSKVNDVAVSEAIGEDQVYYLGMACYKDEASGNHLAQEVSKAVFCNEKPFTAIYTLSSAAHESHLIQLIASQKSDTLELEVAHLGREEPNPNAFIAVIHPKDNQTAKRFVNLYRTV